ncbi:hypothetical protein BJ912DRAFT_973825 [Pholiota molesta]|nr:hypothetical protein BJ912DRAFT_973825 [Pholiota molesta]
MTPVPFPSTDDDVEDFSVISRFAKISLRNNLHVRSESHATTSSSKLTSSDKLSALPTSPAPSPNASRIARSSNFAMANIKRGYRHSLDSPSSLPVITSGDFDMQNHGRRAISREVNLNRYNEETPRQRVSFDSDRSSLPTMRSRSRVLLHGEVTPGILSASQSPSHPEHRGRFPFFRTAPYHDIETGDGYSSSAAYDCDDLIPVDSIQNFFKDARLFVADTLPRELYLNLLLRLPSMYFCRVARPRGRSPTPLATVGGMLAPGAISGIGLSAQVSVAPAASMMHLPLPFPDEWTPPVHSWEAFIDSLLREWKTLNVVSALLASAILTVFQIPEAANDPLTRTFALLSLICALMSLSYGCIYIVRFGTMRSMFHASRWAEEARKTHTSIWWNVWVLLATPAVWMAWAMFLFLSAILSFVWRTGSINDSAEHPPLGNRAVLGPRIGITAVLLLGIIYLGMIVNTLKKYGSHQHQGSAHTLPHAHGKEAEAGKTPRGAAIHEPKDRQRGNDFEMDHRGRDRERSASVHVRRREEDPERRGRRKESRDTEGDSKKAGLKDMLGLRFTSHTGSQRDVVARDNLELEHGWN